MCYCSQTIHVSMSLAVFNALSACNCLPANRTAYGSRCHINVTSLPSSGLAFFCSGGRYLCLAVFRRLGGLAVPHELPRRFLTTESYAVPRRASMKSRLWFPRVCRKACVKWSRMSQKTNQYLYLVFFKGFLIHLLKCMTNLVLHDMAFVRV
jgi:hypothetical protein